MNANLVTNNFLIFIVKNVNTIHFDSTTKMKKT